MQKMNFYIHIGTHKTGSTALQYFFQLNRKKLERLGFCYPKTGVVGAGHHQIAWAAKKKEDKSKLVDLVGTVMDEAKTSGCNNIILSSEEFEYIRDNDALKSLKTLLGENNYKIIVFLRRQDALLESEYNQHVKHANNPYNQSIYKFYFDINFSQIFDYRQLCIFWGKNFGEKAISAINYDRCSQEPLGIFSRFFDVLGLTLDDSFHFPEKRHSNLSLPKEATIYMARLNRLPLNHQQRQLAISLLFEKFKDNDNGTLLSYEDRRKLWGRNKWNNTFIVSHFGFESFYEPTNVDNTLQYIDFYDNFDVDLYGQIADGILNPKNKHLGH